MISEKELAELSFESAPKIITELPGPKSKQIGNEAKAFLSPARTTAAEGAAPESVRPYWERARGATLEDIDGNLFIDLTAGIAVSAVGRLHPKVIAAVRDQSTKIMHGGNESPIAVEMAKKLANIMPGTLRNHCFLAFTQGGSDAVETAIKYAHFITGKSQIIAFEGAYHGVWHGSLAMTAKSAYRARFGQLMPGIIHLPYAYCYRCFAGLKYPECNIACGKYFDYKLNSPATGADDVAAVFIEPVQGEGGYVDPPPEFVKMVKAACDKKGILFIADEVQAGAGRTGKMWSIEHYGITPDILIFGKGIGGDTPMAGVVVREDLHDKIAGATQPNTFSRNGVSCAIVAANVDILADEQMNIVGRVAQVGEEIKNKLISETKDIPIVGEVRGKGFMIGIELVKDKASAEPYPNVMGIAGKVRNKGILVASCGRANNTLRMMPPLVITRDYFNKGIDAVLDVLREESKLL